jgi:predicted DNA-binding transcriptional regulator AlpA
MLLDIPPLLTKGEVTELLRISPRTLERWIAQGAFPRGRRVGSRRSGRVLWLRKDLMSALEEAAP